MVWAASSAPVTTAPPTDWPVVVIDDKAPWRGVMINSWTRGIFRQTVKCRVYLIDLGIDVIVPLGNIRMLASCQTKDQQFQMSKNRDASWLTREFLKLHCSQTGDKTADNFFP